MVQFFSGADVGIVGAVMLVRARRSVLRPVGTVLQLLTALAWQGTGGCRRAGVGTRLGWRHDTELVDVPVRHVRDDVPRPFAASQGEARRALKHERDTTSAGYQAATTAVDIFDCYTVAASLRSRADRDAVWVACPVRHGLHHMS
jgi:hypothetical protein